MWGKQGSNSHNVDHAAQPSADHGDNDSTGCAGPHRGNTDHGGAAGPDRTESHYSCDSTCDHTGDDTCNHDASESDGRDRSVQRWNPELFSHPLWYLLPPWRRSGLVQVKRKLNQNDC